MGKALSLRAALERKTAELQLLLLGDRGVEKILHLDPPYDVQIFKELESPSASGRAPYDSHSSV